MPSSTGNKMLLEHLHKLTAQHEREQIMKTASASPKKPGRLSATDLDSRKSSETSSFYSSSSEDVERGGGVKLTGPDAFVAHNNPFARRSQAAAQALRPTSSATATVRTYKFPPQDTDEEDDVFQDTVDGSEQRSTIVPSGSYSLGQGHLQNPDFKGKGVVRRGDYVGGSPIKGGSSMRNASDPQATYPTGACIFVANLPEYKDDITLEAAVIKEFQRFGVVFVKIRRDPQGLPFGFCQFTTKEHAEDARINGKGSVILGRPCRTETVRANRKIALIFHPQLSPILIDIGTYIIYRRDQVDISMEEANELLHPFGVIETLRQLDPQIREQLQLPVTIRVQFEVFDPSQQVLRAFRLNKTYRVDPFDFKKAMQARARNSDRAFLDHYDRDRRSIFVGDLPLTFTENDVRILMEDIGAVVSVQAKRLEYAREGPKLIAFVEFTNASYPDLAIERYGSFIRVERRTDKRRRDPARNQSNGYNSGNDYSQGHGSNCNGSHEDINGGNPPSTPAFGPRGIKAIEAGPSSMPYGQGIQGTPSMMRPASHHSTQAIMMASSDHAQQNAHAHLNARQNARQNAQGPHNVQGMQNHMQTQIHPVQQQMHSVQQQMQAQMPIQIQDQQMPTQLAQQQMASQTQHQMVQGMHMHQSAGQHMGQTPMQFPMAPPPVPAQAATPMHNNMAYNPSPYAGSPYSQGAFSQGAFSQGPGSSVGFITPQQATPMPFWGYGHGTPLWTPFPVDPAAFAAAAFSSPVRQPHLNGGFAPQSIPAQQIETNQVNVTQSEPVMTENGQPYVGEGSVGNY
ncbi:RNA recognition domain-containing protein [Colletotrichum higginsianum]|nr:RNA recognition domain-containing protein [Colletotrichum higginsianum]